MVSTLSGLKSLEPSHWLNKKKHSSETSNALQVSEHLRI